MTARIDVVVGNTQHGSDSVSVLLGKADGTFKPARELQGGGPLNGVAVGDFDNDGNLDIVIISGFQSTAGISALLGKGDGIFQAAKNYSVPAGVDVVAVGDFNGDNHLDVAVTNSSVSGLVSVLPGNGNGTL